MAAILQNILGDAVHVCLNAPPDTARVVVLMMAIHRFCPIFFILAYIAASDRPKRARKRAWKREWKWAQAAAAG